MDNGAYEVFVGVTGALLLTRGFWKLFEKYFFGYFIFIFIGLIILFYKNKIIEAIPNYGNFSDNVQRRVLGITSALFIGYGIWNYTQQFVEIYTWYIIAFGLFLVIFQKPVANVIKGVRNG